MALQGSTAEPATTTKEVVQKLSCNIDNESNPINYLQDGIRLSLSATILKNSPSLGHDAPYLKTMQISHLVI